MEVLPANMGDTIKLSEQGGQGECAPTHGHRPNNDREKT